MSFLKEAYAKPSRYKLDGGNESKINKDCDWKPLPSDARVAFSALNRATIINKLESVLKKHNASIDDVSNVEKLNADIDKALRGDTSIIRVDIVEQGFGNLDDRASISFEIQYCNAQKTRFKKPYYEKNQESNRSSTDEKGSISIKGVKLETGGDRTSGTVDVTIHNQNYNVFNCDFRIAVDYSFQPRGLIDIFYKGEGSYLAWYYSRGTLETRMDKL